MIPFLSQVVLPSQCVHRQVRRGNGNERDPVRLENREITLLANGNPGTSNYSNEGLPYYAYCVPQEKVPTFFLKERTSDEWNIQRTENEQVGDGDIASQKSSEQRKRPFAEIDTQMSPDSEEFPPPESFEKRKSVTEISSVERRTDTAFLNLRKDQHLEKYVQKNEPTSYLSCDLGEVDVANEKGGGWNVSSFSAEKLLKEARLDQETQVTDSLNIRSGSEAHCKQMEIQKLPDEDQESEAAKPDEAELEKSCKESTAPINESEKSVRFTKQDITPQLGASPCSPGVLLQSTPVNVESRCQSVIKTVENDSYGATLIEGDRKKEPISAEIPQHPVFQHENTSTADAIKTQESTEGFKQESEERKAAEVSSTILNEKQERLRKEFFGFGMVKTAGKTSEISKIEQLDISPNYKSSAEIETKDKGIEANEANLSSGSPLSTKSYLYDEEDPPHYYCTTHGDVERVRPFLCKLCRLRSESVEKEVKREDLSETPRTSLSPSRIYETRTLRFNRLKEETEPKLENLTFLEVSTKCPDDFSSSLQRQHENKVASSPEYDQKILSETRSLNIQKKQNVKEEEQVVEDQKTLGIEVRMEEIVGAERIKGQQMSEEWSFKNQENRGIRGHQDHHQINSSGILFTSAQESSAAVPVNLKEDFFQNILAPSEDVLETSTSMEQEQKSLDEGGESTQKIEDSPIGTRTGIIQKSVVFSEEQSLRTSESFIQGSLAEFPSPDKSQKSASQKTQDHSEVDIQPQREVPVLPAHEVPEPGRDGFRELHVTAFSVKSPLLGKSIIQDAAEVAGVSSQNSVATTSVPSGELRRAPTISEQTLHEVSPGRNQWLDNAAQTDITSGQEVLGSVLITFQGASRNEPDVFAQIQAGQDNQELEIGKTPSVKKQQPPAVLSTTKKMKEERPEKISEKSQESSVVLSPQLPETAQAPPTEQPVSMIIGEEAEKSIPGATIDSKGTHESRTDSLKKPRNIDHSSLLTGICCAQRAEILEEPLFSTPRNVENDFIGDDGSRDAAEENKPATTSASVDQELLKIPEDKGKDIEGFSKPTRNVMDISNEENAIADPEDELTKECSTKIIVTPATPLSGESQNTMSDKEQRGSKTSTMSSIHNNGYAEEPEIPRENLTKVSVTGNTSTDEEKLPGREYVEDEVLISEERRIPKTELERNVHIEELLLAEDRRRKESLEPNDVCRTTGKNKNVEAPQATCSFVLADNVNKADPESVDAVKDRKQLHSSFSDPSLQCYKVTLEALDDHSMTTGSDSTARNAAIYRTSIAWAHHKGCPEHHIKPLENQGGVNYQDEALAPAAAQKSVSVREPNAIESMVDEVDEKRIIKGNGSVDVHVSRKEMQRDPDMKAAVPTSETTEGPKKTVENVEEEVNSGSARESSEAPASGIDVTKDSSNEMSASKIPEEAFEAQHDESLATQSVKESAAAQESRSEISNRKFLAVNAEEEKKDLSNYCQSSVEGDSPAAIEPVYSTEISSLLQNSAKRGESLENVRSDHKATTQELEESLPACRSSVRLAVRSESGEEITRLQNEKLKNVEPDDDLESLQRPTFISKSQTAISHVQFFHPPGVKSEELCTMTKDTSRIAQKPTSIFAQSCEDKEGSCEEQEATSELVKSAELRKEKAVAAEKDPMKESSEGVHESKIASDDLRLSGLTTVTLKGNAGYKGSNKKKEQETIGGNNESKGNYEKEKAPEECEKVQQSVLEAADEDASSSKATELKKAKIVEGVEHGEVTFHEIGKQSVETVFTIDPKAHGSEKVTIRSQVATDVVKDNITKQNLNTELGMKKSMSPEISELQGAQVQGTSEEAAITKACKNEENDTHKGGGRSELLVADTNREEIREENREEEQKYAENALETEAANAHLSESTNEATAKEYCPIVENADTASVTRRVEGNDKIVIVKDVSPITGSISLGEACSNPVGGRHSSKEESAEEEEGAVLEERKAKMPQPTVKMIIENTTENNLSGEFRSDISELSSENDFSENCNVDDEKFFEKEEGILAEESEESDGTGPYEWENAEDEEEDELEFFMGPCGLSRRRSETVTDRYVPISDPAFDVHRVAPLPSLSLEYIKNDLEWYWQIPSNYEKFLEMCNREESVEDLPEEEDEDKQHFAMAELSPEAKSPKIEDDGGFNKAEISDNIPIESIRECENLDRKAAIKGRLSEEATGDSRVSKELEGVPEPEQHLHGSSPDIPVLDSYCKEDEIVVDEANVMVEGRREFGANLVFVPEPEIRDAEGGECRRVRASGELATQTSFDYLMAHLPVNLISKSTQTAGYLWHITIPYIGAEEARKLITNKSVLSVLFIVIAIVLFAYFFGTPIREWLCFIFAFLVL